MKIRKVDHIGVAVKDAADAQAFFEQVLGLPSHGSETVAEQKVQTVFLPVGDTELELLAATAPDSPVAKFIDKRGEGIQHIAFQVDDLEGALAKLEAKGVALIDRRPRLGAGGKKIAFLHPKDTYGVLIELCEPARGPAD